MLTIIFRNHGRGGARSSITISQLHLLSAAPSHVLPEMRLNLRYFDHLGKCVYCRNPGLQAEGGRPGLTAENESFAAFVPFAARFAQIWIILAAAYLADFGPDHRPGKR